MRVLTWNLKHGRSVPSAGRELFAEFAAALAGWEWDVALLQEVPPWWPEPLGEQLEAQHRLVLTSRNAGLALRRAAAIRWPDAIKSNGGGSNAILVRGLTVIEHRARRLSLLPERRWVHAVRVAAPGELWIANLHTGGQLAQAQLAAATVRVWGGRGPAVLGGDFNLSGFSLEGFEPAGGHSVDLVFGRGLWASAETEVLDRGPLSDHAPVLVTMG